MIVLQGIFSPLFSYQSILWALGPFHFEIFANSRHFHRSEVYIDSEGDLVAWLTKWDVSSRSHEAPPTRFDYLVDLVMLFLLAAISFSRSTANFPAFDWISLKCFS